MLDLGKFYANVTTPNCPVMFKSWSSKIEVKEMAGWPRKAQMDFGTRTRTTTTTRSTRTERRRRAR